MYSSALAFAVISGIAVAFASTALLEYSSISASTGPIDLVYASTLIPSSARTFDAIAPAITLAAVSLPELLPPPR